MRQNLASLGSFVAIMQSAPGRKDSTLSRSGTQPLQQRQKFQIFSEKAGGPFHPGNGITKGRRGRPEDIKSTGDES
jgi:hypothetical protein